jgi:hypothetical protein
MIVMGPDSSQSLVDPDEVVPERIERDHHMGGRRVLPDLSDTHTASVSYFAYVRLERR